MDIGIPLSLGALFAIVALVVHSRLEAQVAEEWEAVLDPDSEAQIERLGKLAMLSARFLERILEDAAREVSDQEQRRLLAATVPYMDSLARQLEDWLGATALFSRMLSAIVPERVPQRQMRLYWVSKLFALGRVAHGLAPGRGGQLRLRMALYRLGVRLTVRSFRTGAQRADWATIDAAHRDFVQLSELTIDSVRRMAAMARTADAGGSA